MIRSGVYGRTVAKAPELASEAFAFELSNGHTLSLSEFNTELAQAGLVPRGDIKIKLFKN